MARHKLPLDSPHWVPIQDAIDRRYQQTRSYRLTAADINSVLQDARLRSLERRPFGEPRLLGTRDWRDDLYIDHCLWPGAPDDRGLPTQYDDGAAVFSHASGGPVRERWIYVWKPDLDAKWPSEATAVPDVEQQPRRRKRRPRTSLKLTTEEIKRGRDIFREGLKTEPGLASDKRETQCTWLRDQLKPHRGDDVKDGALLRNIILEEQRVHPKRRWPKPKTK